MEAKSKTNARLAVREDPDLQAESTMEKTIQTLLNGYEQPAILSNAEDGSIVFLNTAAQNKLGLSSSKHTKRTLHDLFSSRRIIQQNVIWERHENQFEVHEEKLNIGDQKYIRSIIKPIQKEQEVLDLIEMQKEMSRLLVHRFHSPLNGITGFTELLKELELTEKQGRYVESIEEGLDDFKEILAEIRNLAEDIEVQYTTINVQSFSQELLDQYSQEEKNRIDLKIDPSAIELHTDFVLLKKILLELLDNALEFSPDSHQNIRLHFRDDGIIRVTNHGKQIPESFTQKMFYPFFSNKARGIGLGLSKCLYFAHELGYEIILSENSSVEGISFDVKMR